MKKAYLASLLLSFSFGALASSDPKAVDPSLSLVSTQADTRILVYSVCSPEHCWSESYFQLLSSDPDPTVLCTTKIKEIFVGHVVESVDWSMVKKGGPIVTIKVSPSHSGFKPYTAKLVPLDGCNYSFSGSAVGI